MNKCVHQNKKDCNVFTLGAPLFCDFIGKEGECKGSQTRRKSLQRELSEIMNNLQRVIKKLDK